MVGGAAVRLLLPTFGGASSMIKRRWGSSPWRSVTSEVSADDFMGISDLGMYRFGAETTK